MSARRRGAKWSQSVRYVYCRGGGPGRTSPPLAERHFLIATVQKMLRRSCPAVRGVLCCVFGAFPFSPGRVLDGPAAAY